MHQRIRAWLTPWRRTPLHPQWFSFRDEVDWLRRWGARSSGLVVDVGSGRQRIRPFLGPDCRYLGTDFLETASRLYGSRPDVYADGRALPIAGGTADTVLLLEVLEHLTEPARAVAEARRVLRDGGTLIVSVPFIYPVHDAPFDFQRWTPAGLREMVSREGFAIEEWRSVGSPSETAALMGNLAIARLALALLSKHPVVGAPFVLLAAVAVPVINFLGWAFHFAARDDDFMPHACRVICRKVPGSR